LNEVFGEGSVITQGGGKRKNFSFRNYFTTTSTSQKGGDRYNTMSNIEVDAEFTERGFDPVTPSEGFTADQKRQYMRNNNSRRARPAAEAAPAAPVATRALARPAARAGVPVSNAQGNLGITAELAGQLQGELAAPAVRAAVTNIVARITSGEALNLSALSHLNTTQQLAILYQIYQTAGTQGSLQMIGEAAHCRALVAPGGAFSSGRVGEFVNTLRNQVKADNRIVQTLLKKFNEGKELDERDKEGLSAEGLAIFEQMTNLIRREETKMGLTKAMGEFKREAVKHKKEFYEHLQMLGIASAATAAAWFAIQYAPYGEESDPTLASATLSLNATAPAAAAAADSAGWGAFLSVKGVSRFFFSGVLGFGVQVAEGASEAAEEKLGKSPGNFVRNVAAAVNPMELLNKLIANVKQGGAVAAQYTLVLGIGVSALITMKRFAAFRRADENIQFADDNLMRLIRTIQGQYLGQLWAGYIAQKGNMLTQISTHFAKNLTDEQIREIRAGGGIETLVTEWETRFSSELQESGIQQIINTLSPQEARNLQKIITKELENAKGEIRRALAEYNQFLNQPLLDQAWAGSHNILATCSNAALSGITTLFGGITNTAQLAAGAALAGGAGVAAVGMGMLQQRGNAENQMLRVQIQRLIAQREAEAAAAKRVANQAAARRVANQAAANQAANQAAANQAARRLANQAAEEARRVASEAAAAAAALARGPAPLGLAPALGALPVLNQAQLQELPNVIERHAEQQGMLLLEQQGMLALENGPAAAGQGGRRHVKRRSMTKKHRKHTKKTRKH